MIRYILVVSLLLHSVNFCQIHLVLYSISFRMFSNEDVTIGSWMLAMNVYHEDNKKLCQAECTSSSIAVWDIPKCSGMSLWYFEQESFSKSHFLDQPTKYL